MSFKSPIVVGGTGGSGTRLICHALQHAGVFMGDDVNYALDAMPWVDVDNNYFECYDDLPSIIDKAMERHGAGEQRGHKNWGWKHTKSYLSLPMLHQYFPEMSFVHVLRDGRDLAYAPHISLAVFWTGSINTDKPHPEAIMSLWAVTNMLTEAYARQFVERYVQVRFEDMYSRPAETAKKLYKELGLKVDRETVESLPLTMHAPPPGIGRWKGKEGLDRVTAVGELTLRRYGYL